MRELTMVETREAAGGVLPVLVALAAAVVGRYIYGPVAPKKEEGKNKQDKTEG